MDADRFDALARSLAHSSTRRSALKALVAAVAGGLAAETISGQHQLDDPSFGAIGWHPVVRR
jgi:hypothetical protein